jgi:hypothetical protein
MKTTQHNNNAGPKEMDQPGGEGAFFVARERERKRG